MPEETAEVRPADDHDSVAGPDPLVKHATASTFVLARLAAGWRLGLILHPHHHRYMVPGGHVESGETPAQTALREVTEECGLAVRLLGPPAAPVPAGYRSARMPHPWWVAEYRLPSDRQFSRPHVHIDYQYLAVTDSTAAVSEPEHPFGWYGVPDLAGLSMYNDTRLLATTLLAGLAGENGRRAATGDAELAGTLLASLERASQR